MHYIVLDLEWNQCPDGKRHSDPSMPFEIIEFGAVKLDQHMQIIGQFHEIVTPILYKKLHRMTRSVIRLTDKDLQGHRHFPEVADSFFSWCGKTYGEDYMILTWGSSDLTELQRNLAWHHMPSVFPFPLYYTDLQKIYAIHTGDRHKRKSLENAAGELHIPKTEDFHGAYADALYTAKIMMQLPLSLIHDNFSVDYYRTPKNRAEEILLRFDDYTKYVTKPFTNTESAMRSRLVTSSVCLICSRRLTKIIPWIPSGSHNYLSMAKCPDHGYVKGKIRVRSRLDGSVYVIKTQRLASPEEFTALKQKSAKEQPH